MDSWYDEYKKLNLFDGEISFTSDDDEDMIEIYYNDGMLIDVGYIKHMNSYVITVVSSNTEEGWKNTLEEIKVENKAELFANIQEAICKYRQNNYLSFEAEQFDNMWKWMFFHNFKESKKKHGLMGAAGILFLLCILQGLGEKFIWHGSFLEGFLYPFALFIGIFIISTILYVLKKKSPKAGTFVAQALLALGVVFLLGIVLLIIVLLFNSFLHFWF
ncbi:MAG: hypothetical protein IKJ80_00980 [Clostridia bacterium]|nr:hypothetical protein [Clostridia bacterium]